MLRWYRVLPHLRTIVAISVLFVGTAWAFFGVFENRPQGWAPLIVIATGVVASVIVGGFGTAREEFW